MIRTLVPKVLLLGVVIFFGGLCHGQGESPQTLFFETTLPFGYQTAAQIDDVELRDSILKQYLVLQAQVGDIEGAIQVAQEIKTRNIKWSAFQMIALILVEKGNFKEALALMEKWGPSYRLYWRIGEVQFKLGNRTAAMASLKKVMEKLMAISSEWARNELLYRLVKSQLEMGLEKDARETIRVLDMGSFKFSSLSQLSEFLVKEGREAEALKIAEGIPQSFRRSLAFKAIALAQNEKGHIEVSLATVKKISHIPTKVFTLLEVAKDLRQEKDGEKAEEILEKSLNIARNIDAQNAKDLSYVYLVAYLSSIQQWEEALFLARQNKESRYILTRRLNRYAILGA